MKQEKLLAGYDAYDARLESLVVETRTEWAPELQALPDEDRAIISKAIHHQPQLATLIHYERTHTGFIRQITVTEESIERLYQQNASSKNIT